MAAQPKEHIAVDKNIALEAAKRHDELSDLLINALLSFAVRIEVFGLL
jgi:hypothetical protein